MSDDREFNRVPMIHVDSVSQQLRRRRGKRKRVPWRRRDLVFAVLAVPVFTALAVAAFEAARHGPRSAILASVLGALIGAPAGVLFGGVALVAFLVVGTGLFGNRRLDGPDDQPGPGLSRTGLTPEDGPGMVGRSRRLGVRLAVAASAVESIQRLAGAGFRSGRRPSRMTR